jgi:hypothetical protein
LAGKVKQVTVRPPFMFNRHEILSIHPNTNVC